GPPEGARVARPVGGPVPPERGDPGAAGTAAEGAGPGLPQPSGEIGGDARIELAVRTAGEHVDVIVFLLAHGSLPASAQNATLRNAGRAHVAIPRPWVAPDAAHRGTCHPVRAAARSAAAQTRGPAAAPRPLTPSALGARAAASASVRPAPTPARRRGRGCGRRRDRSARTRTSRPRAPAARRRGAPGAARRARRPAPPAATCRAAP